MNDAPRAPSPPAHASGSFAIGGELRVHRLGFGAMRLPGARGEPRPRAAVALLREALRLGVDFIERERRRRALMDEHTDPGRLDCTMDHRARALTDLRRFDTSQSARADRLRRFVGPVGVNDAQTVAFWRDRSPAEHAAAGADLSDHAASIAVQTGFVKNPDEMFPGLSYFRRQRS